MTALRVCDRSRRSACTPTRARQQSLDSVGSEPEGALTQWFNRRFAGNGKRMRRVGIVALAIALWRYLDHGEIPNGALLKPAAA